MVEPYVILFQKYTNDAPVKNSYEDFKSVCIEAPFVLDGGAKKLVSRDWADEDGEDVYFPTELPLNAYDVSYKMCFVGENHEAKVYMDLLRNYLTGKSDSCCEMSIWNAHTEIGRKGVYFQSMSDGTLYRDGEGKEVLTFTIKLRVTDPVSNVIPYFEDGEEPQLVVS